MLVMDKNSSFPSEEKCRSGRFDLRVQEYIDIISRVIPKVSPYVGYEVFYPGYIPSIGQIIQEGLAADILKSS